MLIISALMISDDGDTNQEGMEALNAEYTCGRVARVLVKARSSSEHSERPRTKSEDSETFTREKVESRQVSLLGWIERIAMTLVTRAQPSDHPSHALSSSTTLTNHEELQNFRDTGDGVENR